MVIHPIYYVYLVLFLTNMLGMVLEVRRGRYDRIPLHVIVWLLLYIGLSTSQINAQCYSNSSCMG